MQELAKHIFSSYNELSANEKVAESRNIVVVFDGSLNTADNYDIIHKFRNVHGKWAFTWIKKEKNKRQEFRSGYVYDDIVSIKNNRLVFIKEGENGFWYFNTRTEFFYP